MKLNIFLYTVIGILFGSIGFLSYVLATRDLSSQDANSFVEETLEEPLTTSENIITKDILEEKKISQTSASNQINNEKPNIQTEKTKTSENITTNLNGSITKSGFILTYTFISGRWEYKIVGQLGSGCSSFSSSEIFDSGNTLTIKGEVSSGPSGAICTQALVDYENTKVLSTYTNPNITWDFVVENVVPAPTFSMSVKTFEKTSGPIKMSGYFYIYEGSADKPVNYFSGFFSINPSYITNEGTAFKYYTIQTSQNKNTVTYTLNFQPELPPGEKVGDTYKQILNEAFDFTILTSANSPHLKLDADTKFDLVINIPAIDPVLRTSN